MSAPKERALTSVLALRASTPVAKAELLEAMWGDNLPASGVKSLQVVVSNTRRALGGHRLVTVDGGYCLDVPRSAVDALEFEREVTAANAARRAGRLTDASAMLELGLARWRGEVLAELIETPWGNAQIVRLNEARADAQEQLVDIRLAFGLHRELVAELEAAVAEEPLRERRWEQLMLALYRCGRQSEALARYQRVRGVLREELGLEPGRALVELEGQILDHSPDLEARPPVVTASAGPTLPALPPPVAQSRRGPFVGRSEAFQRLTDHVAAADRGHGGLVLVAGEAGIGKTRLAAEIAATVHADGGGVLWGHCDDDTVSPYQPFTEALTRYFRDTSPSSLMQLLGSDGADMVRIVPALAERLSGLTPSLVTDLDAGRDQVFAALSDTLRRIVASHRVLLVLDDLHLARPSALAALRSLAGQLHDTRLLVVATFRDTDVHDDHPLVAVLADLTRDDLVDLVTLQGLERDEVRQLATPETFSVAAEDGAAALDRLHERTGGNPFFCIQLLRQAATGGATAATTSDAGGVDTEIPQGVHDVVRQRIARLGPDVRPVLEIASVLGARWDLMVLEEVAGQTREDDALLSIVEVALHANLLVDGQATPTELQFVHPLVQETLYSNLSAARRAVLHRRCGDVMARRGYPSALVAHHYASGATADSAEQTVEWLTRAAGELVESVAIDEALALLDRALAVSDLAVLPDHVAKARLHLAMSLVFGLVGDMVPSRRQAELAADEARSGADGGLFGDAAIQRASSPEWDAENTLLRALVDEALELIGTTDPARRAMLLAVLASYLAICEGLSGAAVDSLADEALAIASSVGDDALRYEVLIHSLPIRQGSADLDRQRRVLDELDELQQDHALDGGASHYGRMKALLGLSNEFVWSSFHRYRALLELQSANLAGFDQAIAGAEQAGHGKAGRLLPALVPMWKAARDLVDGRFDEADRHNDELLRLGRSDRNMRSSAAGLQFAIARERGTLADVVPLGVLGESVPHRPPSLVEDATGALGQLDMGNLDGARALLDGFGGELRSLHLGSVAASVWSQLAEVTCRFHDERRAAQLSELLTPFRGQLIVVAWGVYVTGSADRFLGMLAATLHRWDDAEAAFASALRLEESIRSVPLAARTRTWWARSLLDQGGDGNVERASELLETAGHQAHDVGMAALSAEIDDLLLRT